MRLIKGFLVVLLVLGVLLVGAVVVIPMVVDPNAYKPQIQDQVKKATGRELAIEGDLQLSVFPWLGVDVGPTRLSNAEGFGDEPFASVDAVSVRVKLLPLLWREIEADTVVLEGLRVALQRNAEGRGNWEDLTAASTTADSGEPTQAAAAESERLGPGLAGLAINGIDIRDAQLRWEDAAAGTRLAVDELNMKTGAVVPGQPLDLDGGFLLRSEAPKMDGRFTLRGRLDVDPDAQRATFEGGVVELEASGSDLPVQALQAKLALSLEADLAAQRFSTDKLELSVSGSGSSGGFVANGTLTSAIKADLAAGRYDLSGVLLSFSATGDEVPGGEIQGEARMDAFADMVSQTAAVSNLSLSALDLAVTGSLSAERLTEQPAFSGQIDLAAFNPRALMKRLGLAAPETQDADVLTKVQLSTAVRGTTNALALESMRLTLDDTNVEGNFAIRDFSAPGYRFDYVIDAIDLDRYMPPIKDEAEPPSADDSPTTDAPQPSNAAQTKPPEGPVGLPLDALRALNLDGRASIGSLKVQNLRMSDIVLQINSKDGVLQLDPMSMRLYQGTGSLKATVDARTDTPAIEAQNEFKAVQISPLVSDLTGNDPIEGTGNIRAQITTAGADPDAMTRNLGGNFAIEFRDGAVKGVNVAQMIRQVRAAIKKEKLDNDEPQQTDFSELSATGTIKNGVIENRDLAMKSPLLRITGEGLVDLPQQSIDYVVTATVVNTTKGQGGKGLEDLEQLPIPIQVTGTFDQPKYTPDVETVLRELAKKEGTKKLEKELDKQLEKQLGEELGDDIGKQLKGLFK